MAMDEKKSQWDCAMAQLDEKKRWSGWVLRETKTKTMTSELSCGGYELCQDVAGVSKQEKEGEAKVWGGSGTHYDLGEKERGMRGGLKIIYLSLSLALTLLHSDEKTEPSENFLSLRSAEISTAWTLGKRKLRLTPMNDIGLKRSCDSSR